MPQGGQGARAEQDRNVMFVVDFFIYIRDPYLLHCFQTRFFVASPTEMIFKARGCARVTDTRIADGEYFFSSLYFSQLTARHNLTSQSMQLINTERATLQYTR
jgi:hypothetical protein